MSISFTDFKIFFSKQAKHGSIILAAIIPIAFALTEFNFIGKEFLKAINQFIMIIGVGIVVFRIAIDEYERAKIKNKGVNDKIDEGDFTKAKDMISDNLGDLTKASVDIAKDVIQTIKKPKEVLYTETHSLAENLSKKTPANEETPEKPTFAII